MNNKKQEGHMKENDLIKFIRRKDYKYVRELGQGACGRTVLLYDEQIDEYYACKKYSPYDEDNKEIFYEKFVREIKILCKSYHRNIVRFFNQYLFPKDYAGFILMEFVEGDTLDKYLEDNPEKSNEIFHQIIDGFEYLEKNNILHRDIRYQNILVNKEGLLKIIDFGFGKSIEQDDDFGKSITLNWQCASPPEFKDHIYNHATDIYFVGNLFQKLISDINIEEFSYSEILYKMCLMDPKDRFESFITIKQEILSGRFEEIEFDNPQKSIYRKFADNLLSAIVSIGVNSKYVDDCEAVQRRIEDLYKKVMLEDTIPSNKLLVRCFLIGSFKYRLDSLAKVYVIKDFLDLFKQCSIDKKSIILSNLHTRLDVIQRDEYSDDVPF